MLCEKHTYTHKRTHTRSHACMHARIKIYAMGHLKTSNVSRYVNRNRCNQNHIVLNMKGKDRRLQLYNHKSTCVGQSQKPFPLKM